MPGPTPLYETLRGRLQTVGIWMQGAVRRACQSRYDQGHRGSLAGSGLRVLREPVQALAVLRPSPAEGRAAKALLSG